MRWFKPMEKEEIRVRVSATGQIAAFNHIIPETRSGPEMETQPAREMAQAFAERHFGRAVTDTVQYKLLEARSEKEKDRMDHHFVWERIDRKVEDGEFRVNVRVQGDEVGAFSTRYKAPEEFLRSLREQGTKEVVVFILPVLLALATLILAGVYFVRFYREKEIRWRFPLKVGIVVVVLQVVNWVNSFPTFFHNYDTSQAMTTYLGLQGIGMLIGTPIVALAIVVVMALMVALHRSQYPEEIEAGGWLGLLRMREGSVRFWAGTLALAAAFLLLRAGVKRFGLYVNYHWLTEYLQAGGFHLPRVNTYLPFLDAAGDAAMEFVTLFTTLAILLIWKAGVKRPWLIVAGLAALLLSTQAIFPAKDYSHFAVLAGVTLVDLGSLVFLVAWLVRFNLMAYIVALWSSLLILGPGLPFIYRTTVTEYHVNGVVILLLGLAPLALPLIAHLKGRDTSSG